MRQTESHLHKLLTADGLKKQLFMITLSSYYVPIPILGILCLILEIM